jgi:adenine phosphoribosyltransferase
MSSLAERVSNIVRDVPDFPRPGVLFKDITPVLADPSVFTEVCDWMAAPWSDIDVVVGIESRGFIFGAPLCERLNASFVPARKKGKLPHSTYAIDYDLEYGSAVLEIHTDAIRPGQRVLICDDLLATGGTAEAAVALIKRAGGEIVGSTFLVELDFLSGRKKVGGRIESLLHY